MNFSQLQTSKQTPKTRVGRGIAAGKGKTAGRGTKGQGARKSGGVRPGFEGGQNPLMQRLPKLRGFRAIKVQAETVYTGQLADIKGVVDNNSLFEAGVTTTAYGRVKLVLKGELTAKKEVKLQAASERAIEAIKKAGGSFEAVSRPQRQTTTTRATRKSKKSSK